MTQNHHRSKRTSSDQTEPLQMKKEDVKSERTIPDHKEPA